MIRITISVPQEIVPIERSRMRGVAEAVLQGEGVRDADINLAFVDNPTIHQLNKRYLDHDEPTDVLSFPLSNAKAKKLEGQLVIGVEVGRVEAERRGHGVLEELSLYVIHGLLHLCGHDDRTEPEAAGMREREQFYLKRLNIPDIAPERRLHDEA